VQLESQSCAALDQHRFEFTQCEPDNYDGRGEGERRGRPTSVGEDAVSLLANLGEVAG
jgi:hypothetical protein